MPDEINKIARMSPVLWQSPNHYQKLVLFLDLSNETQSSMSVSLERKVSWWPVIIRTPISPLINPPLEICEWKFVKSPCSLSGSAVNSAWPLSFRKASWVINLVQMNVRLIRSHFINGSERKHFWALAGCHKYWDWCRCASKLITVQDIQRNNSSICIQ